MAQRRFISLISVQQSRQMDPDRCHRIDIIGIYEQDSQVKFSGIAYNITQRRCLANLFTTFILLVKATVMTIQGDTVSSNTRTARSQLHKESNDA